MTEGTGQMVRSGGGQGGQQVYINVYRAGQNWAGNYSTFRIIVQYRGNGSSAWNASGNNWQAYSVGDRSWSGSFSIPSGQGGNTFTLLDTMFDVGHDGNGYFRSFSSRAAIQSSNTSYIGSGDVTVWEGDSPRIPKRPSPPGTPTVINNLPTSLSISWPASSDDAGSAIDAYLLRYWPNPEGSGQYIDHSQQNNTSRVVTGLQPGKEYRFVVYAHNGAADNGGYSNVSGALVVRTRAGVRIKVDGVWKLAIPYVKVEGAWKMAIPYVKDNGAWKMTS